MTLMTLLGSIGGILQVMTLVISYFAEPIAEISYYINSIMSFYILHSTFYRVENLGLEKDTYTVLITNICLILELGLF